MQCLIKERRIILHIHESQIEVISHITNMSGATHKGTTSPTLDQWLVSLLYLHLLMEEIFNHQANKEIMLEEQGINKKGPSLTPFWWYTQSYTPSWSNSSDECPTKRNPKADNHLLSRKRPTSPRKSTCLSHPQSCDKGTDSFLLHKWQGSTME